MKKQRQATQRRLLMAFVILLLTAVCQTGSLPQPITPPPPSPPNLNPTSPPVASTPSPSPTDVPFQVPEHRIGVRVVNGVGEFYDRQTGEVFIPRGVNYIYMVLVSTFYQDRGLAVGVYDRDRWRTDLQALRQRGYNTVRVFFDSCRSGPVCISTHNGLNAAYLDNMADAMQIAREENMYLLLTSNDLPDGYWAEIDAAAEANPLVTGYRNGHILTEAGHQASERYWDELLTELVAREAAFDAVLGWQLLNEQWLFKLEPPLSLNSGVFNGPDAQTYDLSDPDAKRALVVNALRQYIARTRAVIVQHDPTALVTMGFFAPQFPNPTGTGGDWYVDTAPLLADSALDFFDFHAYPGGDIGLTAAAENFGMLGYDEKPVLLGEYGAFRHLYPQIDAGARAIMAWTAESCSVGMDGWLYWTYYAAPLAVGDATWGLTDEDSYLLDLLAPINHPDPCVPIEIPGGNLAYDRPVRASRSLPDEPVTHLVDESSGTQWGAGEGPPQWVEVDLEAAYTVTEIRVQVAQYPEGDTVHSILVGEPGGSLREVHVFRQFTREGQWLIYTPEPPLANVQVVRIYTAVSPSWVAWREVQVFGQP